MGISLVRWGAPLLAAVVMAACGGGGGEPTPGEAPTLTTAATPAAIDEPRTAMSATLVRATVTSPIVQPSSVTLTTFKGASAQCQLTITLPLGASQLGAAVSRTPWLTVQLQGTTGATLTASALNLKPAIYRSTVTVSYLVGKRTTRVAVPVIFTVTASPTFVPIAARQLTLDSASTPQTLSGSVNVARTDAGTSSWTASSSAPWLVLSPSTGTTPASLGYSVDTNAAAGLPNGATSTATVTLTSPDVETAKFTVALRKQLTLVTPTISGVMPYGIPPSTPFRIVIHGSGFLQFSGNASAVTVPGATVTNAAVTSDSEMTAVVNAPAAGAYTLQVGSVQPATAKLAVAPADPYVASSIANSAEKRNFVHDPVRQAIYATGRVANTLYKFQYAAGSWSTSVLPVDSPVGLALSPDGSRLLVLTLAGQIKDVDPDTLQLRASYLDLGLFDYGHHPAAVTVEGRLWLPQWGNSYFDLQTNTKVQLPNVPWSVDGWDFYGSADGSRMLISPSYAQSPRNRWWLYKSSDASVTNPMGATEFWYDLRLSADGTRLLMQYSGELYDQNYNLLGQVPASTTSDFWSRMALTSDGRKIVVGVSDGGTGWIKRLDIYDTSLGWQSGTTNFVLSASIPVASPPSNCYPSWPYDCDPAGYVFVSLDNRTIFIGGNQALQAYKMP